jgi:predicted nucleotidyltransferase component of viral defense system
MQLPSPQDALHKDWLYRVLSAFYDDPYLASVLYFKGGTCAAMLGFIDRFSVDLDFDLVGKKSDLIRAQKAMEKIFRQLKLEIKDQSRNVPQYFLRYPAKINERNTLKIDISFSLDSVSPANQYSAKRFSEIDRIITCQTPETMFANKLVALIGRYKQKKNIAGRDVYDVHQFFESGLNYSEEVIMERTGKSMENFFEELIDFTEKKVADEFINQDLNMLLPNDKFQMIRKTLKQETLMMLRDELVRIKNKKTGQS